MCSPCRTDKRLVASLEQQLQVKLANEVKMMNVLDHPFIVRLCFNFETKFFEFMCMEMLRGGSVQEETRDGKKCAPENIRYALRAFFGLGTSAHALVGRQRLPVLILEIMWWCMRAADPFQWIILRVWSLMKPKEITNNSRTWCLWNRWMGVACYTFWITCFINEACDIISVMEAERHKHISNRLGTFCSCM